MKISGLQKMTLLDYPSKVACTVFLGGCNFRCPYCHNSELLDGSCDTIMSQQELLTFLHSRKGLLDAVCISGGEPTLQADLPDLMTAIKDMGYLIKLDTNGSRPEVLKDLVSRKLVDYVAMDIKNSPERYAETCGGVDVLDRVQQSAALVLEGSVDYEFRTTLAHPLHRLEDMAAIGQWLQGARRYFLQQFVDSGDLIGSGLTALDADEMETMRQAVLPYIKETTLRGL